MKMTKKLVLAAAALPLVFGTASAYAFGGGKGDHKDMRGKCGGFDKSMMRQLDLTEDQKQQLKDMREASRDEMKGKHGEKFAGMQANHAKVQELVLADTFDEAAANELATQMVEKQAERRVAMLKKQHQMMSVLTAEQKDQLKELQQERMQKCSDKMEKRFAKHDS
ncbi:periplasmic repressor CpxP [Vibrio sp. T187]|uniref:CpxP family protein n=1 Tax=Vibrio TaxID=662 RepID=UPI0010C976AD|nr:MULTISPECIES: CpxP family protein [Vibrio]MBW3697312.1 periplasmic repressor CpxP [Vibrio sp. T187]